MKKEEAIKIIHKELSCVDRDNCKREECKSCDLVMPSKEPIIEAYKMAIEALEQEPRKGHWIDTNTLDVKYKVIYMCSNCRSFYTEMKPINMNFCPNCGAKMEKESEEE